MEMHKLNRLPKKFCTEAFLAVAEAIEVDSPLPVVKLIRQAFQNEYWSAAISAEDATEYVLWLFISKTCSCEHEKKWTDKFMPLTQRQEDLT